ncbi:DUF4148 domain-containing protein [Paraburkholderia phosphatilytica]|uniref:DUF4148 domain-containing protein n=1 Tax=Paraburkholderia phosphatilytica TaxID=2282883 RepID=UPI000E4E8B4A|nr:DUF4148 domain-containing protein [Paraburkholderia phosphatilytica]
MKSLMSAVAVAVLLAAPVASFAQSNNQQPVTRAQVRAELVQLEKAGYDPVADKYDYPVQLQAAEARVAAQNGAAQAQAETTGYGPAVAGTSHAGGPVSSDGVKPVYFGN